ncbi:MAG: hypothetical protein NTZ50_07775 [Chloroflexi bacterium]|nr:hypothetical protein [Chloroflexota bacterium]
MPNRASDAPNQTTKDAVTKAAEFGLTERNRDQNQDQLSRNGIKHIVDAHQDVVCHPARVAGDEPDQRSEQEHDDGGQQASDERRARAIQNAADDIAAAAGVVCTEDELRVVLLAGRRFCTPEWWHLCLATDCLDRTMG